MDKELLYILIEKYVNHTATPEEEEALHLWYREAERADVEWEAEKMGEREQLKERMLLRLKEQINNQRDLQRIGSHHRTLYRWAAAAILILIAGATYFYSLQRDLKPVQVAGRKVDSFDVAPGGNKAILTLANGSKIMLDSAGNGILARQGSTKVIKLDPGQLAYNTNPQKPSVPLYNTISTPKGGQYQVILPDGTHVWLNAASSLTFPTAFREGMRSVALTGEGYFEVAAVKSMPFIVHTAETSIQVLGTHFDVSDYQEDSLQKTTLLEGAVKVTKGTVVVVLEPEEQAQIKQGGGLTVVKAINADRAIAWKNGLFDFDHVGLYSAMRQIARWYDVQVIYERTVPDKLLFGSLPRDTKLSMILSLLRRVDVRCRMEGRTVFVSP